MGKKVRPGNFITWTVKRRDAGWVAVVYTGESPITVGPATTKSAARAIARKRAAEFRV